MTDHTRVLPFAPGSYREVLELQRRLVDARARGETPDLILLGEHERVITLGRGYRESLPALPIPVLEVERGGEATWHGPGQLVGYPIVSLRERGLGVRDYLRRLEQALIDALAGRGVDAGRREGATGVWVDRHKIASIGVAVRRGVTYHGFALNVDPDLEDFRLIRPCGFQAEVMTSLARLSGRAEGVPEMVPGVLECLVRALGLAPARWEPGGVRAAPGGRT